MVKSCCAFGCTNRYHKGTKLSFYRFPADRERRSKWIAALKREDWQPSEHSWVCSAHFVSGKKSDDPLSPDYIPSVFSFVKTPEKRKAKRAVERYEQRQLSKKQRLEYSKTAQDRGSSSSSTLEPHTQGITKEVATQTTAVETTDAATCTEGNIHLTDSAVMTDMSGRYVQALEEECLGSADRKVELECKEGRFLCSEDAFKSDGNKVKFYTGLPCFSILMVVFNFVSPHVKHDDRHSLSRFEQFIATLMKLRLNLFDQDLAYRFGVHQSTISRNFKRWLDVMYVRLKPLIKWPGREELYKTMPLDFKAHFKKCVVIIDCFEVFCERPKPLKARAQTYSKYKHHNTVKFLIGIAPQGVITFISKGWGGRVSDQHLTVKCGILDNLIPGDLVLADRGFNIHEAAGLYCAEVKMPPFTRGKSQLSKMDVDTSRQLS